MQRDVIKAIPLALAFVLLTTSGILPASALTVSANVNVIQPGSLNSGDQNHLQQNEPWITIDPANTNVLVTGANDYRRSRFLPVGVPTSIWMGYYRSTNGGGAWTNDLVPGFPGDNTPQGLASPAHGLAGASDPIMAFDLNGNLYYSFIAFNAGGFPDTPGPLQENGVFVAKYTSDGATYSSTTTVDFNGNSLGVFDDKDFLAVDTQAGSPFAGRVYTCWTGFIGSAPPPTSLFGGDRIMFSFSSDGGQSYSSPHIVSDRGQQGSILNQDCGIATAPDGTIYVTWVTFASGGQFQPTATGVSLVKSTDGGIHFSKAVQVASFSAVPRNNGQRDCCGVFGFRTARTQQPAVDPSGNVYVTYFADTNPAPNFDSSGNVILANIDSDVFVAKSMDGGSTFTLTNITANNVQSGQDHDEVFPAISTVAGRIDVAYYTDINDPTPADNNQPSLALNAGGPGPQALIDVYYSFSTNGGSSWTAVKVTDVTSNANWPMFVSGTLPFHGDYIGIASAGNTVHIVWTDNRNVVFTDPNLSTPAVEANNTGNRDQDIYTATITQ